MSRDAANLPAARLRVDCGASEPVALDLRPGVNRIGRSAENDIQLDHSTISDRHCEIDVGDQRTVLRDLDSTNGTFLDDELVKEAVMRTGQVLRLGEVELSFELVSSACEPQGQTQVASPAAIDGGVPAATARCAEHATRPPKWFCQECHLAWCSGCVKQVELEPNRRVTLCPRCQGLCEPWETVSAPLPRLSFRRGLIGSLGYPFQGSVLMLLVALTLLGVVASVSRSLLTGGALMVAGVALGGYAVGFLRQVLLNAIDGKQEAPSWWEYETADLWEPAMQVLGVYLCSFGPWTIWRICLDFDPQLQPAVGYALFGFGALYFPMALLAVFVYDSLAALNPWLILVSIARTFSRYLTVCLLVGAIGGGIWFLRSALYTAGWRVGAAALSSFGEAYTAALLVRVLGWYYHCSKTRLNWS